MLSQKLNYALSPVKQRIVCIKRQMRLCTKQHDRELMSSYIYYDQMEELSATLNKLRVAERKIKTQVLEDWCLEHPADMECAFTFNGPLFQIQ